MSGNGGDADDRLFADAMSILGMETPRGPKRSGAKGSAPSSASRTGTVADSDEAAAIRALALGGAVAEAPKSEPKALRPADVPRWAGDLSEEDAFFEAAMSRPVDSLMAEDLLGDAPPESLASTAPGLNTELARAHVGTPKALRRRIKQGVIDAQDELDLHGLTKADAFGVVDRFLHSAIGRGLAVVRIITGRGLHSAETAVLKNALTEWTNGPLLGYAYTTCLAPQSHGGEGVTYVFLRRFAG